MSRTLKLKHQYAPYGYWKELSNQRKFFDDLGKKLGIQTLDSWYSILSQRIIRENGAGSILPLYKGSAAYALIAVYPGHNWIPWKFKTVPRNFWKDISNQRKFFDDLGLKIGINKLDDWYDKISWELVQDHGGAGILAKHNHSPATALVAAYPEHNWKLELFTRIPRDHWKNVSNQKIFFDNLGSRIGIKSLDDWYDKLSQRVIKEGGASCLLDHYQGSPIKALMAAYPHHNWIIGKFRQVPRDYWKDVSNQKKFFDELAERIGVQDLDDWYQKLSSNVISNNGGWSILNHHKGSPIKALMTVYPQHNWIPWKFRNASVGLWNSKDNISRFLSELSEKLSIQTLDDWYRVDLIQLQQFGGLRLIVKYEGLYGLLKQQYPHHPWDLKKFQQKGRKAQRWLVVTLQKIFPDDQILEDYIHPKAVFPSSNRPMQLDVFIPSRSLAFEYQGIQHYQEVGMFSPSKTYQQQDEEKRALCDANNIKLIEVPYWWNRTQESLQEMMTQGGYELNK